jgi:hypothetical protein
VYCLHGEGWQADGYVFGTAFLGSGVADPFIGMSDHGLSGGYVDRSVFVFDVQRAFQDNGELVEGGRLAGLLPSRGTAHVGHAGGRSLRIDTSDVFIDELGFGAGGLDPGRLRDQGRHKFLFSTFDASIKAWGRAVRAVGLRLTETGTSARLHTCPSPL